MSLVHARLRDRVVQVDLSGVTTWGGLLEAVSTAAGVYVDSDSTLRRMPPRDESSSLPATPRDFGGTAGAELVSSWEAYVAAGGGDFALQQPRMSAETVLYALQCVAEGATHQFPPHHLARGPSHFQSQAAAMQSVLQARGDYLRKIALAASVMAKVPVQQKKLLNLAHDWLQTFLPHCMKKVNRVSFGLLNDAECRAALDADPMLPPSRLKLSVPFVGKDVPSQSSEFAHPDIILGLSVFGYRYQVGGVPVFASLFVCSACLCVRVWVCARTCACVRACVRARVRSYLSGQPSSLLPPRPTTINPPPLHHHYHHRHHGQQGLRRTDFNDLMDLITANFTHEIGPPKDRPSSVLYRQWVLDAGGAIRGDVPTKAADAGEAAARSAALQKAVVTPGGAHDGSTSTTSGSNSDGGGGVRRGGREEGKDVADDESKEVVDLKYVGGM